MVCARHPGHDLLIEAETWNDQNSSRRIRILEGVAKRAGELGLQHRETSEVFSRRRRIEIAVCL
jgi:hypothetical protein